MCHGCGRLQAVGDACRLTLTRVDVAVGVDSALLAARNYCERAAKELHAAGGRILPKDGRAPPTLQQQLEGLCIEPLSGSEAAPQRWQEPPCNTNTMFLGAQSKFRKASAGVVAAVDCNSVSVGVDSGHYEGPLRVRLPVKLSPASSAEGAWSFVVPLPDPASQKLLSRSVISEAEVSPSLMPSQHHCLARALHIAHVILRHATVISTAIYRAGPAIEGIPCGGPEQRCCRPFCIAKALSGGQQC